MFTPVSLVVEEARPAFQSPRDRAGAAAFSAAIALALYPHKPATRIASAIPLSARLEDTRKLNLHSIFSLLKARKGLRSFELREGVATTSTQKGSPLLTASIAANSPLSSSMHPPEQPLALQPIEPRRRDTLRHQAMRPGVGPPHWLVEGVCAPNERLLQYLYRREFKAGVLST
ncbi:MAG: hypothetical protein QW075_01090 [Thermofilaceae archaeon]